MWDCPAGGAHALIGVAPRWTGLLAGQILGPELVGASRGSGHGGVSRGSNVIAANIRGAAISACASLLGAPPCTAPPRLQRTLSRGAARDTNTSVVLDAVAVCEHVPFGVEFRLDGHSETAPAFTSANSTTFTVGVSSTFTVTASGTPAPTFMGNGCLPNGVTFNDATGVLSGTPLPGTGGTYDLTFAASNGVGTTAVQSFVLTVDEAPSFTSTNAATFSVGVVGSFTVTLNGFPTPTVSESGTLPAGVSFNPSTDVLSGMPQTGTAGTYPIVFTASNGIGSSVTQQFTLSVDVPPTITSANSTTFTVGTSGSFTVTATGTPTPTLEGNGVLPNGVVFDDATGLLSGTPLPGTGGTYVLTFQASNGALPNAIQTFILTVDAAPSIVSDNSTTFAVGTAGTFTVTAHGFPAPTFSETGTLPLGVSFNTSTGVLSGTPQLGQGGVYPVEFTATNGVGSAATQDFTLIVNAPPAFTSANATTFAVGTSGSFTVTASGVPAPTFSESGALPNGVSFNDSTAS